MNGSTDRVPAVRYSGEFTSRLLQHDEWRREALRASQERAIFRAMRHDRDRFDEAEPTGAFAAIGALVVRAGQRLLGRRVLAPVTR